MKSLFISCKCFEIILLEAVNDYSAQRALKIFQIPFTKFNDLMKLASVGTKNETLAIIFNCVPIQQILKEQNA